VNGIVCFTNLETKLEIWNPTVTVLHIAKLGSFFLDLQDRETISDEDVSRIKAELEKYSSTK